MKIMWHYTLETEEWYMQVQKKRESKRTVTITEHQPVRADIGKSKGSKYSLFSFYPKETSRIIIRRNPTITPMVPAVDRSPKCASGISSSTTT